LIDEIVLIEELKKRVKTKRSTMEILRDIIPLIEQQSKINEWIHVKERLPENEVDVEITYCYDILGERIYHTARAVHYDGTMLISESDISWDEFDPDIDNFVYNEKEDDYYIPEGWWESPDFTETSNEILYEVIAWRPLMEPYRENNE
jgi:hypothetical protein